MSEPDLACWRSRALAFESSLNSVLVGMQDAVRMITIAVFARGHVLLEGDVGVGKTTLLKSVARAVGGAYQRIEGTVDLMPSDLVYYTQLGDDGRPRVLPGPLLERGEDLSIFFFNEINRARPQVHALLLRVMAERTINAFNREFRFPFLQVFADRNRVEREETFELPAAARDRFLMEISIEVPEQRSKLRALMFQPRYHDVDAMIAGLAEGMIEHEKLDEVARAIQTTIRASDALEEYGVDLWLATRDPARYGVTLSDVDIDEFVLAGASPRGVAMLTRAARVHAWLEGREATVPEDVRAVFPETITHRICLRPVYEVQRGTLLGPFVGEVLKRVCAP
ncbi:MAG: MoxR family ATPase [Burkholderiales bacterium]|nr:MoxR family ATPase [Burkholderiales bacterium]